MVPTIQLTLLISRSLLAFLLLKISYVNAISLVASGDSNITHAIACRENNSNLSSLIHIVNYLLVKARITCNAYIKIDSNSMSYYFYLSRSQAIFFNTREKCAKGAFEGIESA